MVTPIHYLIFFIAAPILSLVLSVTFKKISLKYGLLKRKDIPCMGGIAFGLAFLILSMVIFYFFDSLSREIMGIISASFLMLVFGFIDDLRELSIGTKFCMQIISATVLIFFGIKTGIVYIGSFWNLVITYTWILGITNAFNHLDTSDGVCAGGALISGFAFFMVALLNNDIQTAVLALILAGAVLSFLISNFPPAKIYMGNCGSHFLGFVLAAIALTIDYAPSLDRKIALLSPLLILGLPIFDTAFLVFIRMSQGRPIAKKSNDHLALRFIKIGYSKHKTLMMMLFLGLVFALSGVLVSQLSNLFSLISIITVILISLGVTLKMGKVRIDG